VRAENERAERVSANAEQADLLRIVVGRLQPALRDSISQLARFRTSPTDSFSFRRAVRQTERQVASVSEFIQDLQLLSELLDGWRPTIETVLLAPLLASIVEQLTGRAHTDSKVTLQLRMVDDLLATRGDAAMLRRAIFNLVDNALRFTGPDGVVTISVRATDTSTAVVEIRDTGRGMTPKQLERLVKKREGSIASEHRGAGLGWRLASAILEAHDGSVVPLSEGPDQGSTIRIALPRVSLGETSPAPA